MDLIETSLKDIHKQQLAKALVNQTPFDPFALNDGELQIIVKRAIDGGLVLKKRLSDRVQNTYDRLMAGTGVKVN